MNRAGAVLFAVALAVPLSSAAEDMPPNLSGIWNFEAQVQSICSFTGQARLIPNDDPATYRCELTARQDCPAADVLYTVEQSCSASVEEGVLTVESSIESFLEGEPTSNYLPDNFQLVVKDEATLDGFLLGTGAYPAIWRRADGAIS